MIQREKRPCTCPHEEQTYGRLYGVSMGRGLVRTATTSGCPEHDTCHHWTKARRTARTAQYAWSMPWCPVHATRACPS